MLKTYDFKGIKIDEISEINDLSIKQFSSEHLGITGLRANVGLFDEMGANPLIWMIIRHLRQMNKIGIPIQIPHFTIQYKPVKSDIMTLLTLKITYKTGFELKLWRRGMNWDQERAAEELGVSVRTYKRYEKAQNIAKLIELATFALNTKMTKE